jgi:hypothetical protein
MYGCCQGTHRGYGCAGIGTGTYCCCGTKTIFTSAGCAAKALATAFSIRVSSSADVSVMVFAFMGVRVNYFETPKPEGLGDDLSHLVSSQAGGSRNKGNGEERIFPECCYSLRVSKKRARLAVALWRGTGSNCLAACVNAFCIDHIVRGAKSS